MHTLTDEAWSRRAEQSPESTNELEDQLDREAGKTTLELNKDFFRLPGQLPFLGACAGWFNKWLIGAGFDEPKAASISQRLRTYFVYALNQEWREHSDLYAPIVTAKDTPFTSAGERERAWQQYVAWLDQELDGAMFGEPFSLLQLYIPLRAYYVHANKGPGNIPQAGESIRDEKRTAVELGTHLMEWLKRTDREDAVRVLSGGPGSGKSSFARMFTATVCKHASWRALHVPLHRIQYKGEIVPAIEDYVRRAGLLPGNPNPLDPDFGDPQLLLIFDGLDELAMLGKLAQETASQFVRAVKELVRDSNTTALRLKVILTGRTVIMQSLESEFRKEGSILHLCPYFVETSEQQRYQRGWALLNKDDQRQQWWRTYGLLTGKGYDGLPEHFDRADLAEVSSEPLLNYLLALADQTEMLDFSKHVTQNQIYASLIHELHDRRWAGGENFALKGMTEDNFHRVLEEIAVAAWHGDGRKTTVGEIKRHCQDAGITQMLETFQEGAESGVLRLLTAFFFRQAGVRDDENAFEFTHKSFGEYLVARRLVRMLGIMEKKSTEQKNEFTGWDERKCLEEWARLSSASPLTERQADFLRNEIHGRADKAGGWQALLVSLVNTLLRHGVSMEKLGLLNFRSMRVQSRNAEEALLVTLNACACVTRSVSNIDWPEVTSAGTWFKLMQGQRLGEASALFFTALSYTNFERQCFQIADLLSAKMSHSLLGSCQAQGIFLCVADLEGADLASAELERASLDDANLPGANLKGAKLLDATFHGAKLDGADLEGAHLERVNFENADLTGANLRGANLARANLKSANLAKANLENADLRGTTLKGAKLEGANLDGAKLDGASLP